MPSSSLQEFTRYVFILCWVLFVIGFIFRKKIPVQSERKRNTLATTGMLLEVSGYALVWFVHREFNAHFLPLGVFLESIIAFVTISLAISSVWLILSAIKALGKHWTPAARMIEQHELVTAGPYNLVRHPIYSGMFGLMLATGLAYSKPLAVAGAVVACLPGTLIRIRIEEKLLIEYFGEEYADYRKKRRGIQPVEIKYQAFPHREGFLISSSLKSKCGRNDAHLEGTLVNYTNYQKAHEDNYPLGVV